MSDEQKPDIELSPEAKEHFIHMTVAYMQALDELAPTETAEMKALVFVIPTDPEGKHDGHDVQMAGLQMMTNLERGQIKKIVTRILEAIEKAEAKGHLPNERVIFGHNGGGLAN